jgi:hypothetical protein
MRKTYDYGPNFSGETWSDQKSIPHQEVIQKIKEKVIPLLKTAKSHLVQNSAYVPIFKQLCNDIETFFPEKQAGGTGPSESHRKRIRELIDELRRLLDESDVQD